MYLLFAHKLLLLSMSCNTICTSVQSQLPLLLLSAPLSIWKGVLGIIASPISTKDIKSFYMRMNEDGKTVAAMDILAPGIGEIVGGSQREERLDKLTQRMNEMKIPAEELNWYLDTRRFGSCPHAGFGLGFERLVQFVTGMGNIRDVIPFPRYPKSAEF